MVSKLRSWWQKTSKTLDAVIIISLVIVLVLLVLIILGYILNWSWTGLHGRTLYDWLQLLIIPAVLAVGGYLFNFTTGRNERQANEQRAQTEREAAEKRDQTERDVSLDNQREAALQAYIDSMSELLLHEKLRESAEDDEVRKIARVRTLTVLPRLDGERKRSVLLFLYESGLIEKNKQIIALSGADLTYAKLGAADLRNADLSDTFLREADLRAADLRDADLSKAYLNRANLNFAYLNDANLLGASLSGANLINADLSGAIVNTEQLDQAKSLQGAIMPDGTKHA